MGDERRRSLQSQIVSNTYCCFQFFTIAHVCLITTNLWIAWRRTYDQIVSLIQNYYNEILSLIHINKMLNLEECKKLLNCKLADIFFILCILHFKCQFITKKKTWQVKYRVPNWMTQKFGRIGWIATQNDVQNIRLFLTQLSLKTIQVHIKYREEIESLLHKVSLLFY